MSGELFEKLRHSDPDEIQEFVRDLEELVEEVRSTFLQTHPWSGLATQLEKMGREVRATFLEPGAPLNRN